MVDLLCDHRLGKQFPGVEEAAGRRFVGAVLDTQAVSRLAGVDLETVEERRELIRGIGYVGRGERGRIPGVGRSQGVQIISRDPLPPITGEIATGSLGVLNHGRRVWNPEKAVIVFGTSILPLVTIPVILVLQQRGDHVFHQSLSPDGHVVGDEMRLVLYPIPDEPTPYVVVGPRHLRKAGKVSVEVVPLHVGNAEGYEYRRHVLREEASLSMEVVALVPPKGTCPGQVRTLSDDLWKKSIVGQQGASEFLPVEISQARRLRHVKPGGRISLPPHQKVEDEEAPTRVATEPPLPIAQEVPSVIVEGHLPNSGHVEISLAGRI